jgi:hypothetical protein
MMWLLTRFDRRNTEQHGANMDVLKNIEVKIDKIDDRIDGHIDWHAHNKDGMK